MSDTLLQDLYTELTADATLAALVSSRVYPNVATQGAALPYIVYTDVSLLVDLHLAGQSGLREKRVQLDCYATTKSEVMSIQERVIELLVGIYGNFGDTPTTLLCATLSGSRSSYDEAERVYGQSVDIVFHYRI